MKHIIYPTIASTSTIGGIPRIALIVLVSIVIPIFLILALKYNPILAIIISAVLFGTGWIIMKIISFKDPDYILISATKLKNLKQSQYYVA
ncbi:hypothetical protein [Arcobacter porcinus]|uniref:hypothetical protein n=1 Tax=Arcobacter porcinus TaxID=1935204 RepID=UPI00081E74FE|nr:hypothetical protein [Arcobacter porcinus]OCL81900.1 hypothetical protein AAW29_01608 [Arcobacter porcinus]OCL86256.1 hypothetical protein AAX30_01600 [Arcobacter porcinus]